MMFSSEDFWPSLTDHLTTIAHLGLISSSQQVDQLSARFVML
jgi:hypothetical protein